MAVIGALVSLLRGKQFYFDDKDAPAVTLTPVDHKKRIIPNGHALTPQNGASPVVADDAPAVTDDAPSVARRDPASPRRGGSA